MKELILRDFDPTIWRRLEATSFGERRRFAGKVAAALEGPGEYTLPGPAYHDGTKMVPPYLITMRRPDHV